MGILNDWFRKVISEEDGDTISEVISGGLVEETPIKKVTKNKSIDSVRKISKKDNAVVGSKKITVVKKTVITLKKKKVDSVVAKKVKRKVLKKVIKKDVPEKKVSKKHPDLSLRKFEGNPIIAPSELNRWESKATFNPEALHAEGKVHLLYRAMGDGDISVLGYMASDDGFVMNERLENPAFFSTNTHKNLTKKNKSKKPPISYVSGGGLNGGVEDPRATLIGDTVYLTYTAFDGWGSVRMALSSIKLKDFLKKKWNWKNPILISPPGEIHKNWVLFPEKIDGKFAVLHSVNPDILVEYLDELDFKEKEYINGFFSSEKNKNRWDSWVRGAGAPPIKTKDGWLLIYHAMDIYNDPDKYKMGAMLLDLKDPQKIIARSTEPILEPDMHYENEGWKAGVSYCCGAVVKDEQLLIYYGGADKYSCVAMADLDKFIKTLLKTGNPKVKEIEREENIK